MAYIESPVSLRLRNHLSKPMVSAKKQYTYSSLSWVSVLGLSNIYEITLAKETSNNIRHVKENF